MVSMAWLPVLAGDGFDDLGRSFHIGHRSKILFWFGHGLIEHFEALGKLVAMGSLSHIPLQSQAESSCLEADLQAGVCTADSDQYCLSRRDSQLCM